MRIPRAAALALACALTLAGCSADGEPKGDESTWNPTSTPEQPSTSPAASEESPPLPEEARKATEAGARAFIAYYWAMVDYATATGDVAPLDALAGPACEGCGGGSNFIRNIYKKGGTIAAGPYIVRRIRLDELDLATGNRAFLAVVATRSTKQVITVPGQKLQRLPAANERYTFSLVHTAGRWRVDTLGVD